MQFDIIKSYPEMLKLARARISDPAMAIKVAKHCVATGCNLRHGTWEMYGRKRPCQCSPCVKARGKKPVCL